MKIRSPHINPDRTVKGWRRKAAVIAAVLVLLLVFSTLTYLVTVQYLAPQKIRVWAINHGYSIMRQDVGLRRTLLHLPANLVDSLLPANIPDLVIDIKFKDFQKIRRKRNEALEKGFLMQGPDDFVTASIRFNGKTVKVKMRLKGDLPDHLQGDKWSFRIKVKGDDHIMGLRRFSIQHPGTRAFQAQPLLFSVIRKYGILAPRYSFVNVTVNGNDIGLMAMEEHFSKELLEAENRRESVILKFDETNFWKEWMATGQKGTVFNNYKTAEIDAFRSSRVLGSEKLRKDYRTAAGLLRAFVNGKLAASDVFDARLMGYYLAISQMWGATHSLYWNNMRFYYNSVTVRLEPIAFDSYRKFLRPGDFTLLSMNEPIIKDLLADEKIFSAYLDSLLEIAHEITFEKLLDEQRELERQYLALLKKEFFLLQRFPYDMLISQAEALLESDKKGNGIHSISTRQIYPFSLADTYPVIAHAYVIEDDAAHYLEIENVVPHTIQVQTIEWISDISGGPAAFNALDDTALPLELPPTPPGARPLPKRIYFRPPPDAAWRSVQLSANIENDGKIFKFRAKSYYSPLEKNPLPVSSAEKQASRHGFLSLDSTSRELRISKGTWEVGEALIVPEGYGLTVEAGTTLRFNSRSGLIAYGPLYLKGTEESPVILEGAPSAEGNDVWLGAAVMNAGAKSRWSHVFVKNTTAMHREGWELTGGVTFYKSDIGLENCMFINSTAEDALNIVQSEFSLMNVHFTDTVSDALDSDFSRGTVRGGIFEDIGGDGIDVAGSRVSIIETRFAHITDKALSVGERSNMKASDITVEYAGTGAASKDGSRLEISDALIAHAFNAGLTAYIKKPEYGPANIIAHKVTFMNDAHNVRAQKGSSIVLDNIPVETEDIDVDRLYRTIMKPGARR